jgi:hypothetical protein
MLGHETEPHMSFRKRKAEAEITGLERPVNTQLLKLFAIRLDALPPATADHWRRELRGWLFEIADIRLKPSGRPAGRNFYYRILFDEPFGDVEVVNTGRRLHRIADDGYPLRADADPAVLAERLRDFHEKFAAACAKGEMSRDRINALVAALPGEP